MLKPRLIAFIRASIPSIWALELVLLLKAIAPQALPPDEIVQKLRATRTLVNRLLTQLADAGLVALDETGSARFACARPELGTLCDELEVAALERPVALRDAIMSSPNDKLKNFADAFRLKPKDKEEE